jgi:glycosyltransferase involved in cell wall biosynthesis
MAKTLTVSVIIPVYNEERTLADCLRSIQAQTVQPLEVIVVNNNSTDKTVEVARSFKDVKIINEPKQGVLSARATGFTAARGDIIGRIDADTWLEPDWAEKLQQIMNDSTIDAVTGSSHWYDMPLSPGNYRVEHFFKNYLFRHQKNFPFLFGTNMAIRRSAWHDIKDELCVQDYIFEDADIAIHLFQKKRKIVYDKHLRVGMSARRGADKPRDFLRYIRLQGVTYRQHGIRTLGSSVAVFGYLTGYVLVRPLVLSYDSDTGKYSLKKLFFNPNKSRPLPFN